MNLAIDQSPRLIPNANKIVLAGQAYLKDFYHSFGFKDTSDGYLEDGIPHINMAMPINQ
jgi:ElaA protein